MSDRPSFFAWLVGRLSFPPARARCTRCGRRGAGGEAVARRLRFAGLPEAAERCFLCADCRRKMLTKGFAR